MYFFFHMLHPMKLRSSLNVARDSKGAWAVKSIKSGASRRYQCGLIPCQLIRIQKVFFTIEFFFWCHEKAAVVLQPDLLKEVQPGATGLLRLWMLQVQLKTHRVVTNFRGKDAAGFYLEAKSYAPGLCVGSPVLRIVTIFWPGI